MNNDFDLDFLGDEWEKIQKPKNLKRVRVSEKLRDIVNKLQPEGYDKLEWYDLLFYVGAKGLSVKSFQIKKLWSAVFFPPKEMNKIDFLEAGNPDAISGSLYSKSDPLVQIQVSEDVYNVLQIFKPWKPTDCRTFEEYCCDALEDGIRYYAVMEANMYKAEKIEEHLKFFLNKKLIADFLLEELKKEKPYNPLERKERDLKILF